MQRLAMLAALVAAAACLSGPADASPAPSSQDQGQSSRSSQFDPSAYSPDAVIRRDVAVIGGGSSGTYGAINLRLKGHSVALVEKEPVLGGHTNTYHDPVSGQPVDYGVQSFWNISIVRDYFAHFDIPLGHWPFYSPKTHYADFRTGAPVAVTTGNNYSAYYAQFNKYPYLDYSWDLPNPVPADLLVPFTDFIQKYKLQGIAYSLLFNAQGLSNVLQQPTVNVFKYVDSVYQYILDGQGVAAADHDNHQIYDKALAELGPDALVSSTVVAAQRPDSSGGVSLVVQASNGTKSLVQASKLLVTIPLLTSNMAPFDLDSQESGLFSQWSYSAFYTMLIRNVGLDQQGRYENAVPSLDTYNIPALPAGYQLTQTQVPDLWYVWYASPYDLSESTIKANVTDVIKKLRANQRSNVTSDPEFVAFKSHSPFKLEVSPQAVSDRFYDKLKALQGHRNTWYSGAAVITQNSALLWNFTSYLIPDIVKG